MNKWEKSESISCGKIMKWRASVIECQCPDCKRWCLKWADVFDYEKCPHCGQDMRGEDGMFMENPTEVVKIGEPISNSDEISKALEKGEIYKRRYFEFVGNLENFLNQYDLTIDFIKGSYKPLLLDIRIKERSEEE